MRSVVAIIILSAFSFTGFASTKPVKEVKKTSRSYVSHYENVLGTSMEIKIKATSEKKAAGAEKAALAVIERLSKILSGYDANSEFSKWFSTTNQPVHISKDLFTVLQLFDQWRQQTNGALDASAEVIGRLWKQAAANGQYPAQTAIYNAVAQTQQTHWKLDAATQTATHLTNTPLRLNSFAKSYIIKAATDAAMVREGINGIVVNIGGDMVIAGDVNETVLISNPTADAENDKPIDQLQISNKAIATSGNYRRGEMIDGKWYSHIIDPRTGIPANNIISATVAAPSATDAGALATAFNILTPAECIALASTMPGIDYLIITRNGDRIESKNWKSLQIPANTTSEETTSTDQKEWKNDLTITLELTQQQGFAKRPFAAVWVTNKDGATVKTIALWYNKPRWISDLKEWYHANGNTYIADNNAFASITGATRSPGKYTLKWDGKDDNGNILEQDMYTINIEVVREHGGYDLLHQEINCNKTAKQFNLKGKVEIAEVYLDYRKK